MIIAAVFAVGFIAQRGTTCAVIATRRLVLAGRPERFIGFILCAAIATLTVAVARWRGAGDGMIFVGHAASSAAALGGVTLGVGAWLNGRCAMGTIAGLGSGELRRIGTILGFLAGAWLSHLLPPIAAAPKTVSPLAGASPTVVALGAAIVAVLAWAAIARHAGEPPNWRLTRSMPLIGLINGWLLIASQGWAWTALLGDVAMGHWMGAGARLAIFAVLVGGAIVGGMVSDSFRLQRGTVRGWGFALLGGALMGAGSMIVPGGNDTMLMVGLPLLIPNLVTGYAALYVTLALIVRFEHRFAVRP